MQKLWDIEKEKEKRKKKRVMQRLLIFLYIWLRYVVRLGSSSSVSEVK